MEINFREARSRVRRALDVLTQRSEGEPAQHPAEEAAGQSAGQSVGQSAVGQQRAPGAAGSAGGGAGPEKPQEKSQLPADYDELSRSLIPLVRPYTMTSPDKLQALISAVRYIATAGIPGAFVECGVWRGGSMHAVARTLDRCEVHDRDLYLFDTFQGMTEPTGRDRKITRQDVTAAELMKDSPKDSWLWAVASKQDVLQGISTLPYPQDRFHLVEGPVEETVPGGAPDTIALLRLDTDWYESTRHELVHLYPRLQPGGVLIIDDYGTWQGSKEATDEFLAELDEPLLLLRAGRARIAVKPGLLRPAGGPR